MITLSKTCLITVLFFPPLSAVGSLALGNDTLEGLSSVWELLCSMTDSVEEVGRSRSNSATGSADGSALVVVVEAVEVAAVCEATAAAGLGAAVETSLINGRIT